MKKTLFYTLLLILLFSCRKKGSAVYEPKLVKLQLMYNDPPLYYNLIYDDKGRITSLTSGTELSFPVILATISYTGNEAVITQRPKFDGLSSVLIETRLIMDSEKKPVKKIKTKVEEYLPPNYNYTRRRYLFDTTFFEYYASGLLQKTRHFTHDSDFTEYVNGSFSLTKGANFKTRDYINDNGSLSQIKGFENQTMTISNSFGTNTHSRIMEEIYTYNYNGNFPNKTDFSNASILTELQLPYMNYVPLNPNYLKLPDSFSYEEVLKTPGGVIISTNKSGYLYTASYNESGFLKTLFGSAAKFQLIYDR